MQNQMKDALRVIEELVKCLTEVHQDEIRANHYDDGDIVCSYCETMKWAARVSKDCNKFIIRNGSRRARGTFPHAP